MKKRVLFALSGMHRVVRGAEVALESIAQELAVGGSWDVTVVGSGRENPDRSYKFQKAGCIARERFERWPRGVPLFRNECAYEELTFAATLSKKYSPDAYDVTVSCTYPFVNWALRARGRNHSQPRHVYVTQNGDWPAVSSDSEFKFFDCDGLVCTNPEYYERNRDRWRSVLIPNGVNPDLFSPGDGTRPKFHLPEDRPVALMVSALIPSKRVLEGIRCASKIEDLHLLVAGDGPLRQKVEELGKELMGSRFQRVNVPRDDMPSLYRSANLFLHMSQDEPSANAYIEALSTGLPVVTHDRLVTRWTFEDGAVLVDTSDSDAVVRGIQHALESQTPANVEARRDIVHSRFSWHRIAERYGEFFNQLLKTPEPEYVETK